MKIKTFALGSILALSALAINAQASTWTVTTQGTIQYGYDYSGLFGVANGDLTGLTFTQSITANVDPAQWSYNYSGGTYAYVYGNGPAFSDTVTVNGQSVTFNIDSTSWGEQYLSDYATVYGNYWGYDEVYSYQYGYGADGQYIQVYNYADSQTTPFVPSVDFSQSFSSYVADSGAYFYTWGNDASTYFYSYGNMLVSVNGGGDVPEPASLALLGLGLAGLAASRRKRA